MLIKAYSKSYLEDVSDKLGAMLEYAVGNGFSPKVFWEMFVSSKVASEIERGNPKYLAGCSPFEYANIVVERSFGKTISPDKIAIDDSSYWAGYSLANLQYETGFSFYELNKWMPIQEVLDMYGIMHEADIRKFIDLATSIIKKRKTQINLKTLRLASGLTQRELSLRANVDLRSIQMYEQGRNDINKAQVETLHNLAKALGCRIEDLLEH
ncbi:MAG: helix-turn-helix transcriptional regulator [Bacilli bacterium]|nr:helix-turn-helix transcriptional regulator [Bacilli bacterium]